MEEQAQQQQQQQQQYRPKYTPNRWVLLKLTNKETGEVHQRVFAGWFGGFTHGDSWRLNSGIADMHEYDKYFVFESNSGKEYICYKNSQGTEGMSMYMINVLDDIIEKSKDVLDIEIVKI